MSGLAYLSYDRRQRKPVADSTVEVLETALRLVLNHTDSSRFPLGAALSLNELSEDPYPAFARLREQEPISFFPDLNLYLVTRYEDVYRILHDSESYVVGTGKSIVFDIFGEHMMTTEDPEHARHKSPHKPFFLPQAIRKSLRSTIVRLSDELIDDFVEHGEAELRQNFSSRLPIQTMLELFGLPRSEEPLFRQLYDHFELALSNFTWEESIRERGKRAAETFHEVLQTYLDAFRSGKRRDERCLLAALVKKEGQLSDAEIRHNAIIIFFGGISTVDALILNTLYTLSLHPQQMKAVLGSHAELPKAINETIRWLSPVQSATRHVAHETALHGVRFKPGDTVNCMLSAANRDPAVFQDPDRFDIGRKNAQRHLGFAVGPHHCLGSNLARLEAQIALRQLFLRLPNFKLDLDRTAPPTGFEFRQPQSATALWG